jgi:hypothetical protein
MNIAKKEPMNTITRFDLDLASSLLNRVQQGERPPSESRAEILQFLKKDELFSSLSDKEIDDWRDKMYALFEQRKIED